MTRPAGLRVRGTANLKGTGSPVTGPVACQSRCPTVLGRSGRVTVPFGLARRRQCRGPPASVAARHG